MSYTDIVLDHFHAPRNQYRMDDPDAVGVAGEPGFGNFMVIYLKLDGDRIVRASFQTHGCCPSIAAGSWLTMHVIGRPVSELRNVTAASVDASLGDLPVSKKHCAALAAAALREALARAAPVREWKNREDEEEL